MSETRLSTPFNKILATPLPPNQVSGNKYPVPRVAFLPARASEQGNVIGLVSVYIIYIYYYPRAQASRVCNRVGVRVYIYVIKKKL